MAQAQVKIVQVPEFYDVDYLNNLLRESDFTVQSLAVHAGHSPVTIAEALRGEGKKFRPVWDMIQVLDGDWETLFQSKSKKQKAQRAAASEVRPDNASVLRGRSSRGESAGRSK